jgi:hypothetical protein
MGVFPLLREQIENPNAAATPMPKFPGLGMCLMNVMPEVLGHSRPSFAQG